MKKAAISALLAFITGLVGFAASAQRESNTIPDVTGLSVPAAIVQLHNAGLQLGTVAVEPWSSLELDAVNTVAAQTPLPGSVAASVDRVHLAIWREPNVTLFYDKDRFTLLNQTDEPMYFANLRFVSAQDDAVFFDVDDDDWVYSVADVASQYCIQMWSFETINFVELPSCSRLRESISLPDADDHFWLGEADDEFYVLQDEVPIATCSVANPDAVLPDNPSADLIEANATTCELYISPVTTLYSEHSTAYAYFVYNDDQLYIYNRSQTDIMPIQTLDLQLPDLFDLRDADFYDEKQFDEVRYLAAGQCLWFYTADLATADAGSAPLQDCTVVGSRRVSQALLFWEDGFALTSRADGEQRRCAPPVGQEPSICLLPR